MELPIDAKAIDDFPGYYVTPAGEVWSTRTSHGVSLRYAHRLRGRDDGRGHHLKVALQRGGRAYNWTIHRLVAKVFLLRPVGAQCVRHLDDNGRNNHLGNLAWGTLSDNARDAMANGRRVPPPIPRGEKHHLTTLMPVDVLFIRERRRHGESLGSIGHMYGITRGAVSSICLRKNWKHLP